MRRPPLGRLFHSRRWISTSSCRRRSMRHRGLSRRRAPRPLGPRSNLNHILDSKACLGIPRIRLLGGFMCATRDAFGMWAPRVATSWGVWLVAPRRPACWTERLAGPLGLSAKNVLPSHPFPILSAYPYLSLHHPRIVILFALTSEVCVCLFVWYPFGIGAKPKDSSYK